MVWQNSPPPERATPYDWSVIHRRLRRRPGKWLLIAEQQSRAVQSNVRRGRIAVLRDDPDYDFQVKVRNTNGSRADIWMSAQPRAEEDEEDAATESGDTGTYGE